MVVLSSKPDEPKHRITVEPEADEPGISPAEAKLSLEEYWKQNSI